MAKKTLLQITQSVMSSMNSDNVSSIDDLEESMQVAEKAKEVYEDLMVLEDWEHLRCLVQLYSLADNEKPNYLKIPDSVSEILDIRYDKRTDTSSRKKYEEVIYKAPDEFVELLMMNDTTSDNVMEVEAPISGVPLYIRTDVQPTYWTTFDEEFIIFDSFDSTMDSCLQQSKNLTRCTREPEFAITDQFIPDLPSKMFPAYIQEVTRVCSLYFREQPSANDERRAFRSLANMKNKGGRVQKRGVSYGRR